MRRLSGFAALLLCASCLPNPQSVAERRESFDRDDLQGELLLKKAPDNMQPIGALFGGRIKLVGASTDPAQPKPGDRVTVTFYWSATDVVAEDYQVFVHGDAIGGNSGRIHGDHYPAEGRYPTDVWRPGEIIADPFKMWIPPGYGPKKLGIYTGLYKEKYRVPLSDKGQRPSGSDNRSLALELNF